MTLSTYDDLQNAIADYIMRSDAPIKSFIALAQSDVSPFIKHYLQEKEVALTTTANTATLPADFQEARRIVVDGQIARPISAYGAQLRAGEFGYYQRGKTYVFAPERDEPREVEITYYARIPVLSDAEPSNWLTLNFPSVLFHASLIRAYRWMKDADAEAMEKASLREALGNLHEDNKRAVNSGNQLDIDWGGSL